MVPFDSLEKADFNGASFEAVKAKKQKKSKNRSFFLKLNKNLKKLNFYIYIKSYSINKITYFGSFSSYSGLFSRKYTNISKNGDIQ
jgi:hypothetical protein